MSKTTTRYEPKCGMHGPSQRHDGYKIGPVKCGKPATKFVGGKPYCGTHYLDACYFMAQQIASLSPLAGESPAQILSSRAAKIATIFHRFTGTTLAAFEASRLPSGDASRAS